LWGGGGGGESEAWSGFDVEYDEFSQSLKRLFQPLLSMCL